MRTISMPARLGLSVLRVYRYAVLDSVALVRRHGWRDALRQRGWKFFAAVVAYYLVRDTVLYVLVPLCLARRLF